MTSEPTPEQLDPAGGAEWRQIAFCPNGVLVSTKIDDRDGARNFAKLRRSNNLFWTERGDMYVYYTPTHWRHV